MRVRYHIEAKSSRFLIRDVETPWRDIPGDFISGVAKTSKGLWYYTFRVSEVNRNLDTDLVYVSLALELPTQKWISDNQISALLSTNQWRKTDDWIDTEFRPPQTAKSP